MTTPTTETEAAPALATITCPCGFTITGSDEDNNLEAFTSHNCANVVREPRRWYRYLFDFWGWAIVATIGYCIAAITGHAF